MAICKPRMRSDGRPATVATTAVTATPPSSASGHGAPRPPMLTVAKAPMPRNAPWASDSWPVRPTSTSSAERGDGSGDHADEDR